MKIRSLSSRMEWLLGSAFVLAAMASSPASAQTLIKLVTFNINNPTGVLPGLDGQPMMIADASGNLFGVTTIGGAYQCGTLFEVAKTTSGYASSATLLATFDPANCTPNTDLIMDAQGNLFGTSSGFGGNGTVFEIVKTSVGYASSPITLAQLDVSMQSPGGTLTFDADGNLFGTSSGDLDHSFGTVYEIVKTVGGYASTPVILYTFASFDPIHGSNPSGGLIVDAHGNLFGPAAYGGAFRAGAVFEIPKINGVYASTPTVLASFNISNGVSPFGTLIADTNGNLFRATLDGGAFGAGTLF